MKAVRFHRYGPPDVLVVEDAPKPTPGPRDVLIAVVAAGTNPVDHQVRAGVQRAVVPRRLPFVLGMDVSGVVEAVGTDVTEFAVGDAVFASPDHRRDGSYAEYVVVDASEVARKPTSITHAEAASLPLVGLTAWDCLVSVTRVQPGEKVLIQAGSGGVGTFAIQLAKHLGAEVSTTCSARNVELVTSLGTDHVVDHRSERFEDVLPPQDVVLESMGGDIRRRSLTLLRRGGRMASINPHMPQHVERWGPVLGIVTMLVAVLWVIVTQRVVRGVRVSNVVRTANGEVLARIADLVDAGAIRPVIDQELPLEEAAEAHRYGETGRSRGKVVLRVRPEPGA